MKFRFDLYPTAVVHEFPLLLLRLILAVHIEAHSVRALDHVVKELEGLSCK